MRKPCFLHAFRVLVKNAKLDTTRKKKISLSVLFLFLAQVLVKDLLLLFKSSKF